MRLRRMLVPVVVAVVMVAACGGDDDDDAATDTTAVETTTTTLDQAAAQAEITTAFTTFFDGKVPAEQKIALLEDGETFRESLLAGSQGANAELAAKTTTKVRAVEFLADSQCEFDGITPPCAKVTHDLILDGNEAQPALEGQFSYAVLVEGGWKLSKISYCGLVALGGETPDVCR